MLRPGLPDAWFDTSPSQSGLAGNSGRTSSGRRTVGYPRTARRGSSIAALRSLRERAGRASTKPRQQKAINGEPLGAAGASGVIGSAQQLRANEYATRVGGGSTLRRFAALYSESLRSLRRALNMNAKYAGEAGHCAKRAPARGAVRIFSKRYVRMPARSPPSSEMGGLIVHASAAPMW